MGISESSACPGCRTGALPLVIRSARHWFAITSSAVPRFRILGLSLLQQASRQPVRSNLTSGRRSCAAAPQSRLRRVWLRKRYQPFCRRVKPRGLYGPSTWIRQGRCPAGTRIE
jgi:hypothetical protein